nr:nibrin-like [Onthophagus taurus]
MYIIQAESGPQAFYVMEQNKEYVIGRKGCEFLIENDSSVSKRHATITLKDDILQIEDVGSKFSTFINSFKIEENHTETLRENDVVRFGMLNSYYKVIKKNLVVLCSGLTPPNKTKLKQMLETLNGKLVKEWDEELNYLTVDKIVLTSKVIQAIIEGLPIVSLGYFEQLQNCIKNNQIPPNEKEYLPKPSTILLKNLNFDYNPERKSLFKNKVFVFKRKSNLDDIINRCGGKSIIYNEETITKESLEQCNPQYILISDEVFDPKSKHPFDKLIYLLIQLKKRAIPQQEIPLAIMKCCIKTNCNPDFDRVGNLLKESDNSLKPNLLVAETESKFTEVDVGSAKIVPETFQSQFINDDVEDILKPSESERFKRLSQDDIKSDNIKKPRISHNIFTSTQIEEDKIVLSEQSSNTLSQMFKRKTPDVDNKSLEITKKQKILNPFGLISSNNTSISSSLKTQLNVSKKNSLFNPFATATIKEEPQASTSNNNNTEVDGNVVIKDENCGLDRYQTEFLWKTINENDDGEICMKTKDLGINKLMESFKDCVVVKKVPLVVRDTSALGSISFNESGKPNFKRFKKLNPLHVQTSVIKNFKTYVCCVDGS